jgi:outer membrane protein OmpA-like peptidoglycan-associated protein
MMKALSIFVAVLFASFPAAVVSAQETNADLDIQKKEAELQRQKLALEKKSLDLQQKELELQKAKQDLQYQETGKSLSMNLSGDVLFDYDKATLKPAAEEALKKVAVVLSQFPESSVVVEGYTDAKGKKSVNMDLSRERATVVKEWLVKNGGVSSANISAKGFGEDNPVAPNENADGSDDPIGRAKNRRVTIIVEKMASPAP